MGGGAPPWVAQFDIAYLSLLDFGDQTRELRFPECVWGCNMAVRREVLYSVGGFNPDGFGDRRLIWLRGDGECGLQEKISNRELRIIYEPRAWVYHRIPASRVTPQYFYRRLFDDGIMHSYIRIRKMGNCRFLTSQLLGYGIYCFLQSCQKYLRSITASRYQRGGSGNSDSVLSGSLASPKPPAGGEPEERGNEKNTTESRGHV